MLSVLELLWMLTENFHLKSAATSFCWKEKNLLESFLRIELGAFTTKFVSRPYGIVYMSLSTTQIIVCLDWGKRRRFFFATTMHTRIEADFYASKFTLDTKTEIHQTIYLIANSCKCVRGQSVRIEFSHFALGLRAHWLIYCCLFIRKAQKYFNPNYFGTHRGSRFRTVQIGAAKAIILSHH